MRAELICYIYMEIYNVTYNETNSILFIQSPLCGEIKNTTTENNVSLTFR